MNRSPYMTACCLTACALLFAGCAKNAAPQRITSDAPAAAESQAEAAAEEETPAVYSNVTIAVRRNAKTVSERSITDEAEVLAVQQIVFDYMVKSAAWEGLEASGLPDVILLSFDWTRDGERQTYYQFDTDGRHVLQAGETGMYTIMSEDAYKQLLRLAGIAE